ncbi:hypothetical protein M0811_13347 [Anaeramoeba ignava]|uniref:Uncharacterized protein n=1 Tax=Anaeramoeba ignava TaxID=1746090 RepID=A0A9Q0L998_ANAIG|nr:hypothetical protein M0811_13347 [Anaeramoeba ignava]
MSELVGSIIDIVQGKTVKEPILQIIGIDSFVVHNLKIIQKSKYIFGKPKNLIIFLERHSSKSNIFTIYIPHVLLRYDEENPGFDDIYNNDYKLKRRSENISSC